MGNERDMKIDVLGRYWQDWPYSRYRETITKESFYQRCGFKHDEIDEALRILGQGFYRYCLTANPKTVIGEDYFEWVAEHEAYIASHFDAWEFLAWIFQEHLENGL